MPAVECMSGTFGPFSPNYPVIVPLWLALYFRQTGTCSITPPAFLSKAYLEALLDRECKTDVTFEMMPFHFFEIAKLFFQHAPEDIADMDEVMRLVPEIQARRKEKILQYVTVFTQPEQSLNIPALRVASLVSMELHFLRASFSRVLNIAADMNRRGNVTIGPAIAPVAASTSSAAGSGVPTGGATPVNSRPSDATSIAMTVASSAAGRSSDRGSVYGGAGGAEEPPMLSPGEMMPAVVVDTVMQGAPQQKKRRTLRQR